MKIQTPPTSKIYRDGWDVIWGEKKGKLKEGDICPFCKEGKLEFVEEVDHWQTDHLMCSECDSTYCIEE